MKRRILCFVLTMAMVLSMLVVIPATTVSAEIEVDSEGALHISTAADLRTFRDAVNNGDYDSGVTVYLEDDIDLSGENWSTSIGNSTNPFKGYFDGQGHTISGLTRTGGTFGQSGGLFGTVSSVDGEETTIGNFKLAGSIVGSNGGDNVGTVVCAAKPSTTGEVTVSIIGVWSTVNFDASAAKMTGVGGILGTIAWCTSDYEITVNIDSCRYSGTLNSPSAGSNDYGGILGYPKEAASPRTINITNCIFDGSIVLYGSTPDDNGGIVGYFKGNGGNSRQTNIYISDCIVAGKFEHKNTSNQTVTGYVVSEASGSNTDYAVTNVYYCNDSDRYTGSAPGGWYGYGSTSLITATNVTAKTMTELKSMTSGFDDDDMWHFGESDELPVPAMIYDNIIANQAPSIFSDLSQDEFTITSDEEMAEFVSLVNAGTTFAGKTIKLGADVTLTTTVGSTDAHPFSGNFNGQGHTVTISQTLSNPDGAGGLFSFVRVPADSTLTIQNVHLAGTISLSNTATGKGYVGALVSCVDAGTSGSGGTLNVTNVWSTTRINAGNTNTWYALSSYIGFVRHASGLKPITINIDSCLWDAVINAGPALEYTGAFVGHPGNQGGANRPLNLNITNSVAAGTIMLNTAYTDDTGLLVGYLKGNGNNSSTSVVTANFHDLVIIGKFTSSVNVTKWCSLFQVSGTDVVDMNNFYYVNFSVPGKGDIPVYEGTATVTGEATVKTKAGIYELTTSDFTTAAKWNIGSTHYPCPQGIVDAFGSVPATLAVTAYDLYDEFEIGTAEALNALATAVNGGKTYEGKTIKITADITIESGWTSIGITSSAPFMGNFDGQGHTIEIHQTLSNPDGVGGLIAFSRTPAGGEVTIENLHLTGRIDATNSATGKGYFGGLAGCVDANTSGTGGTINFKNVWNSLYINCGNTNMWTGVGGYIGFVRHASGLKPLTINFNSCVWDGTLNAGPAAYHFGGFIGYTGNNPSGRTLTINITNSVASGKIAINQTWDQYAGVLIGYARGGYSDDATAKVTVNVSDVVSTGTMTFKSGTPGSGSKIGHIGRIDDTTNNEINMTNLYYNPFSRGNLEGNAPALDGTANSAITVEAKDMAGFYALTADDFSDSTKWNKTEGYIACPASIVTTFGEIPEVLAVDIWDILDEIEISSVAEMITLRDRVNGGKSMEGKTIKLTADIDLDVDGLNGENEWIEIGRGASNAFKGTFDGQGHTLNYVSNQKWTTGYIDTQAGLFGHLNGATIKDLRLTGSISLHNNAPTSAGETDYIGSVAGAVTGTTLIQNVYSLVDISTKTSKNTETDTWPQGIGYVGGLVGFIPHNTTADITIEGCTYAGTINAANQAKGYSGIMAYTGKTGTKTVTITGTHFTGKMTLNENSAYAFQGVAGIFGVVESGTVTITESTSGGKIYFNTGKAWPADDGTNPVKVGQIVGYVNQSEGVDTATLVITDSVYYLPAKYYTALPASEDNKYVLPEIGRINGVYGGNGGDNSPAQIGGMGVEAEARDISSGNTTDTYKGVRFVATYYNTSSCTGGGTKSANFGIFIMPEDIYDILSADGLTQAELVANTTVVQVAATKVKNNGTNYVVSAVVFNLNNELRQATKLVAVAYAGSELAETICTTSYNTLFPSNSNS